MPSECSKIAEYDPHSFGTKVNCEKQENASPGPQQIFGVMAQFTATSVLTLIERARASLCATAEAIRKARRVSSGASRIEKLVSVSGRTETSSHRSLGFCVRLVLAQVSVAQRRLRIAVPKQLLEHYHVNASAIREGH